MNISKKLLGAVLPSLRNIQKNYYEEEDDKYFVYDDFGWHEYNIYELAHKCKEWATKKGYEVDSSLLLQKKGALTGYVTLSHQEEAVFVGEDGYVKADTEPEAVTKACEWILKEQNEK